MGYRRDILLNCTASVKEVGFETELSINKVPHIVMLI